MSGEWPFLISAERLESTSWKTYDPFLFCAYHQEDYPPAASEHDDHASMGPDPRALAGRALGHDFSKLNGFSMYHGRAVPGFPAHRHFGFETVTIVRKGVVDHFDSLKGMARYADNDIQWLSAGNGIIHSEMFPLLDHDNRNQLELIQIWLNLPASRKRSQPSFHIGWAEEQAVKLFGSYPEQAELRLVAGSMFGLHGMTPPPHSYATDPNAELVIAIIRMAPGSSITLPPCSNGEVHRALYLYMGSSISLHTVSIDGNSSSSLDSASGAVGTSTSEGHKESVATEGGGFQVSKRMMMVHLHSNVPVQISCGSREAIAEMLLLQALPLREPVFQSGPYVASSRAELLEVMMEPHHDIWPFKRLDQVHSRYEGRFFQTGKKGEKHRPPIQPA